MDRYDYVWLGTWDGLDRYDGSNIKVYKPDPFLPGAISNNVIRNFLEDGRGYLWVITHLGINKYNRTTDTFQTYLDSLNDIPFLEYNIRACVGSDSAIWTSLIGKGISRYSFEEDTFLPVHFQGIDPLWLTEVVDLGFHEGLLFLFGDDGKMVCTIDQRIVYSKQLTRQGPPVYHKFLHFGQDYYLALVMKDGQLLLYNLTDIDKEPVQIELGDVSISSLSENLSQTALWAGTESGDIYKIVQVNGGFTALPMNSYFPKFSEARTASPA